MTHLILLPQPQTSYAPHELTPRAPGSGFARPGGLTSPTLLGEEVPGGPELSADMRNQFCCCGRTLRLVLVRRREIWKFLLQGPSRNPEAPVSPEVRACHRDLGLMVPRSYQVLPRRLPELLINSLKF